ncbi:MAG: zinc protease [Phenylobacterium sp.]|jgi:zinc protease
MNRTFKSLVSTLSLYLTVSFNAQAGYALPEYQQLTLENGMSIYLMEQHEVPLINVNLMVKVGAIHDGQQAGLNRLTLANMALGSQQQSKAEIEQALDFIGADLNTHGGTEMSAISASFINKDQAKVLTIIRDMLVSPRFDPQEFDKHRNRYLVQLGQQKERPRAVISRYFNKMIYGQQGYGSAISGNTDTIKALSLDDLKNFYQSRYQPRHSAVVVVGDFDSKKMLAQLKGLFKGWKNNDLKVTALTPAPAPSPALKQDSARVLLVNKSDAIETTFLIGGKGIARSNPDYIAVSVLNTILGGRFTSWLNDALRVNAGLTYGARSRFDSHKQSGSFAISTFTKTQTTVAAVDLALETYQRMWQQGIDQQTLDSAKSYVKGQFPPRYETSEQLADLLGDMFIYGFNQDFINQFEQQVNSMTIATTKQLIKQYFPKENLTFVMIGNAAAIKDDVAKYGKVRQVNIQDVGF